MQIHPQVQCKTNQKTKLAQRLCPKGVWGRVCAMKVLTVWGLRPHMLRNCVNNKASGPEIGLPGKISAEF